MSNRACANLTFRMRRGWTIFQREQIDAPQRTDVPRWAAARPTPAAAQGCGSARRLALPSCGV